LRCAGRSSAGSCERLGVDVTEITAVRSGPLARARVRLGRATAPPSLGAQVALIASAFLLGGVLTALLFVGVWRHTAAEGDRAREAQAASRHALLSARSDLAVSERELADTRAALAKLRNDRRALTRDVATLRRVNGRAAASLPPRLRAIAENTDALAHDAAKLASALATLGDYVRRASPDGVDPAFLAAQVQYLSGPVTRTQSAAASLADQVRSAQAAAASLRQTR
jgi:uncharacterized protein YlxW (UPF0749 family)